MLELGADFRGDNKNTRMFISITHSTRTQPDASRGSLGLGSAVKPYLIARSFCSGVSWSDFLHIPEKNKTICCYFFLIFTPHLIVKRDSPSCSWKASVVIFWVTIIRGLKIETDVRFLLVM